MKPQLEMGRQGIRHTVSMKMSYNVSYGSDHWYTT